MKEFLYYFPNWVIIDYLSSIKTNKIQCTNNFELFCSFVLSKFCEKQFNEECLIGFEVEERYKNKLPKDGLISKEDFSLFIDKGLKKNTPVDFSIAIPSKNGMMNFQLKRFGKSPEENNTDDLIDYINKFSKEYGQTGCNLVIVCESCEVDFLLVSQKIKTKNYPFKKVILLDFEGADYININGLWSDEGESGSSKFNFNTMKFDY